MMEIHVNPLIKHAVRTAHDVTHASILFPNCSLTTSWCYKRVPKNSKIDLLYSKCLFVVLKCYLVMRVRTDVGDAVLKNTNKGNVSAQKIMVYIAASLAREFCKLPSPYSPLTWPTDPHC